LDHVPSLKKKKKKIRLKDKKKEKKKSETKKKSHCASLFSPDCRSNPPEKKKGKKKRYNSIQYKIRNSSSFLCKKKKSINLQKDFRFPKN
jgi:hypothetical protein